MQKRVMFIVAAVLILGSMAWGDSVTGVVTDAMCGVKHAKATADDVTCVKRCGDVGEELMVLGPDNKMYRTEDQAKLKGFEGQRVKVTGKFEPMDKDIAMTITSVEPVGASNGKGSDKSDKKDGDK